MPAERRVHRDDAAVEQLIAGLGAVVEREELLERPQPVQSPRHRCASVGIAGSLAWKKVSARAATPRARDARCCWPGARGRARALPGSVRRSRAVLRDWPW